MPFVLIQLSYQYDIVNLAKKLEIMDTVKKEIKALQEAWKRKETGMSVNEYTSTLHQLYQKLK